MLQMIAAALVLAAGPAKEPAKKSPTGQPVSPTHVTTTNTTVNNGAGMPSGGLSLGMSFTDPDTGETVNMGVSAGAFGSTAKITEQTTVTTTVNGATAAPAPVAMSGKSGILEFTSQDGESFTVFLDGKLVGTFNGLEGDSIKVKNVTPGEHKLVIKDFMENDVWTAGRLLVDPGFTLKIGVDEQGVEVFNRQAAWRPGS